MCVTDVDDVDDDICAKALQQEQMTQKLERQKQLNFFKQQQLIKEEQQLRIVQAQSLQAVSQQELGHAAPETEEGAPQMVGQATELQLLEANMSDAQLAEYAQQLNSQSMLEVAAESQPEFLEISSFGKETQTAEMFVKTVKYTRNLMSTMIQCNDS